MLKALSGFLNEAMDQINRILEIQTHASPPFMHRLRLVSGIRKLPGQ